jgi:hypothetical protein
MTRAGPHVAGVVLAEADVVNYRRCFAGALVSHPMGVSAVVELPRFGGEASLLTVRSVEIE